MLALEWKGRNNKPRARVPTRGQGWGFCCDVGVAPNASVKHVRIHDVVVGSRVGGFGFQFIFVDDAINKTAWQNAAGSSGTLRQHVAQATTQRRRGTRGCAQQTPQLPPFQQYASGVPG